MKQTNNGQFKFKGVALFGIPGSGKTTIAKKLKERIGRKASIIESSGLLYKLAGMKGYSDSAEKLINIARESPAKRIGRLEARQLFNFLFKKYRKDVVAKMIVEKIRENEGKLSIVSGCRGINKAMILRKNGVLTIFLKTNEKTAIDRITKERNTNKGSALEDIHEEEKLYKTSNLEELCDVTIETDRESPDKIVNDLLIILMDNPPKQECRICVNDSLNPTIHFNKNGLCNICQVYKKGFDKKRSKWELEFIKSLAKKHRGNHSSMVGISGGKDSTVALYLAKKLGLRPAAFTFDIGYYPKHIFTRSGEVAKRLDIKHEKIDIRKYISKNSKKSYGLFARLYEEKESPGLSLKFRQLYKENRKHYSVKCDHQMAFVRSCQLCRKTVIKAYYQEAIKRNIPIVILGINEWTTLSKTSENKASKISGIRKLKPYKNKPAIYVVHLPFLLQRKIKENKKLLKEIGWQKPKGEELIESNSNSCLLGLATEAKAERMLGFHPDSTRLAREVTVGFLSKSEAKGALKKIHEGGLSVRKILKSADLQN